MEPADTNVSGGAAISDVLNVQSADTGFPRGVAPPPASSGCSCGAPHGTCTCNGNGEPKTAVTYPFIYALGRIQPRFPRLELEKEFAQATGRAETAGLTDRGALHAVLTKRENRYLARSLCWVFTIEGLETYLLQPRDPADLELLVESLRPVANPGDLDAVIGVRGPIAPLEMCNGLMVPIMIFTQLYSFDRDTLVKAVPRPEKLAAESFEAVAGELFDRVLQMADNAGATDEHRAMNYLVVRYPAIYALVAERYAQDNALTSVDVRASPLSGARKLVEVRFAFTSRATDVTEKFFVRVDVTGEFPFLVTKLSPYYDR